MSASASQLPCLSRDACDLIRSGRMVIRAKLHYRLTQHQRAVLDALVTESLSQGAPSVVMPSSAVLHSLCGVPRQHIPAALDDLVRCKIVQTTPAPDGMVRYAVNPDHESWRATPVVGPEDNFSARSLVARLNNRVVDTLPENFRARLEVPLFRAVQESGQSTCQPPAEPAEQTGEHPTSFLRKAS